jgi:hypothetical protein
VSFDPACNAEYLRKRFDEAIWESPIMRLLDVMDPDELDPLVTALVERLLIEMGAE